MIFKITNQDNDKYLICCNFGELLDIIKQFNMSRGGLCPHAMRGWTPGYHLFILNSNDSDTFNMEELDERD